MARFYAQPYGSGNGFSFDSFEDFETRMEAAAKRGQEEFEIDYHGSASNKGSKAESELANKLLERGLLNQANMLIWFDEIEDLPEYDKAALYWWVADSGGDDLEEGLAKVDCCLRVMEGSMRDYAYEFVSDVGVPTEDRFFDYESFGRDLQMDMDEEDLENYEGMSDADVGEQYVVDTGGLAALGKKILEQYFDYDEFARELRINGDAAEFRFAGKQWVMTTPHEA